MNMKTTAITANKIELETRKTNKSVANTFMNSQFFLNPEAILAPTPSLSFAV